jgi:hypothetical protein
VGEVEQFEGSSEQIVALCGRLASNSGTFPAVDTVWCKNFEVAAKNEKPEKEVCFSGILEKYKNDQNRPCL